MRSPRLLVAAGLMAAVASAQESTVRFNRDVRPILSENCYQCHGPDPGQRKRGLRLDSFAGATALLQSGRRAVVPGDTEASELLRRVAHEDIAHRMPPASTDKSLTATEVELLRAWILAGAEYEAHWAFVPPRRPAPPAADGDPWPRGPIDRFVLARLLQEDLRPAAEAPRETLIRRATLDLTGLPPTPEEVDAFVADDAPDAYARLLERLLDSPRFGEHMARYWLDAARYGDSHGYHLDNVRSLWPWRDWVVAAFNDDKPFDEFTVEQLAGDLLPAATVEQRVATGFNRCNVTTGEGGLIEEEYLVKYAADRVATTATVWMGLTAGCAQCHDHKFDPLTQKEFYQLFDFFHSVDEEGTDRNALTPKPSVEVPTAEQRQKLDALAAEVARLDNKMAAPDSQLDAEQQDWERQWTQALAGQWQELQPLSAISLGGAALSVQPDRTVLAAGHLPDRDVYEVIARTEVEGIVAVRLEALLTGDPPGVGRASHANIVLSTFELEAASAGRPLSRQPVPLAVATADYAQRDYPIAAALDDKPETGWAIDGGREDRTAVFGLASPAGAGDGTLLRARLKFESRHEKHSIGRLRLSVSADPRVLPATTTPWQLLGPFPVQDAAAAHAGDFGPEANSDPTASWGALSWQERPDFTDSAVHQLPGNLAAAYLQRTITAPSERPMTLALGSDDTLKVWLNGELVLDRDVRRPVAPDQDRITVRLNQGDNRLLLKIVNAGGGYGFYFRVVGEDVQGLPTPVVNALVAQDRTEEQTASLRAHFRRNFSPAWKELEHERSDLEAQRGALVAALPRTMVMADRAERRPTHFLIRGEYDRKGERVFADVPAFLPPLPDDLPVDRLALARWLVSPEHPLTARVTVNRFWQQLFGTGIVETAEDFGSQGAWPSHPDLLDWLATEFVASGWSVKHVMRLMLTSATYRQTAAAPHELRARDPDNRLLARGPRFRLDAEMIRDQALFTGGLLVEKLGGPGVKPYQPPGIWQAVGYVGSNTQKFQQDQGDALYRRSLYTFWKRTAPPPALALFDAPSREQCRVRRARTNTPLQALATLNDVQFVEASRHLAIRTLRDNPTDDRAGIERAFRRCTARRPDDVELATLTELLREQRRAFRADSAAARELLAVGDAPVPDDLDPSELAAWTVVASVLLNLDEALTKG